MTDEERKYLVDDLIQDILDVFIDEIPREVMVTPSGTRIMYDVALNLYAKLAIAMDIDSTMAQHHVKTVLEGVEELLGKLEEPKVVN